MPPGGGSPASVPTMFDTPPATPTLGMLRMVSTAALRRLSKDQP